MYVTQDLPQLRFGTAWTEVEFTSEVGVRFTRRGYTPCLLVKRGDIPQLLYCSAVSLGTPLEKLREERGGLTGCRVRIRKKGPEPTAAYEVETVEA